MLFTTKFKIASLHRPTSIFVFWCACQKLHENNCCVCSRPSRRFHDTQTPQAVCTTEGSHRGERGEANQLRYSIVCVLIISKIGHFTRTSVFSYFFVATNIPLFPSHFFLNVCKRLFCGKASAYFIWRVGFLLAPFPQLPLVMGNYASE